MKKKSPLIMGFEKIGDAVLPWNNEGVPTWGLFRVMHAAEFSIQRDHDLQKWKPINEPADFSPPN
jgi:hypothetical protein